MYRDVAQWSEIRDRVLRYGVSIKKVARETGIDPKTVRKMLHHPLPQPYRPRHRRYAKLGPHIGTIQRMLGENATLTCLSIKAVYERARTIAPEPHRRKQVRDAAFEWMRAILQKKIRPDALRQEIGDVLGIASLLDRLYDGRLSHRNRSMVVLASRRGLSRGTVCEFLGIDRKTHRKYLRAFENGGQAALFARRTKSIHKFDNEAVKQAVFGLLHEPPSDYGINRTTWIMCESFGKRGNRPVLR